MNPCRDVIITSKDHIAPLGFINRINRGTPFSFFRSRSSRAVKTIMRMGMGLTAFSTTKVSSVTL